MTENINTDYTKSTPPRPDLALNKKTIAIALTIVALVTVVAFNTRIIGGKREKDKAIDPKGSPGLVLNRLPSAYNELPKPIPFPSFPALQPARAISEKSDLQKAQEKLELERLKRAADARLAKVSFDGLDLQIARGSDDKMAQLSKDAFTQQALNPTNSRDEANRQDDKKAFLEQQRTNATLLTQPLVPPLSPYQLMAGTIVPGVMLTGINSDLPGEIQGQVSQNVFDTVSGNYLLIPQGTKALGKYDSRISYGQERVLIVWTRLIMPNGNSISLEGMPGVDLSGYAGLSDQVNNHFLRLLTGVLFSSVLSASAQMAEGPTYNTSDPSFGQLATQGAAKNINDVGQEITRKNLNIQPTLEIRPGFRFNLLVNKDIILEPYEA